MAHSLRSLGEVGSSAHHVSVAKSARFVDATLSLDGRVRVFSTHKCHLGGLHLRKKKKSLSRCLTDPRGNGFPCSTCRVARPIT